MLTDLEITTIDCSGTRKREDGFYVDSTTGDVYIVCVVPNISLCIFDEIEKAVKEQKPKSNPKKPFFLKEECGLNGKEKRKVLILRLKSPDYTDGEFSVGEAIIKKFFTFEEVDSHKKSKEISLLFSLTKSEGQLGTILAKDVISLLLWKINTSAQTLMSSNNIPYFSHSDGKISLSAGFCKINTPLRDVVSLVNMLQLARFLETGNILFSKEELFSFI